MFTLSFLKAIFPSIVVPHGADGDQLGPDHHESEDHVGSEHHKNVIMKILWPKTIFPANFKRKKAFQMILTEILMKSYLILM